MNTTSSLTSHFKLIRDKFLVKDRLDIPFVRNPKDIPKTEYWTCKTDDKFRADRLIHDIRDRILYPMRCLDTGNELEKLSDDKLVALWGSDPLNDPTYS